jgi:hypothetical protein
VYGPPLNTDCTALEGPATVCISTSPHVREETPDLVVFGAGRLKGARWRELKSDFAVAPQPLRVADVGS